MLDLDSRHTVVDSYNDSSHHLEVPLCSISVTVHSERHYASPGCWEGVMTNHEDVH